MKNKSRKMNQTRAEQQPQQEATLDVVENDCDHEQPEAGSDTVEPLPDPEPPPTQSDEVSEKESPSPTHDSTSQPTTWRHHQISN